MRVESWERRSEIPLLLLALAFLVAYAWPIIDTDLDRDVETFLQVTSWTVWGAYSRSTSSSGSRWPKRDETTRSGTGTTSR